MRSPPVHVDGPTPGRCDQGRVEASCLLLVSISNGFTRTDLSDACSSDEELVSLVTIPRRAGSTILHPRMDASIAGMEGLSTGFHEVARRKRRHLRLRCSHSARTPPMVIVNSKTVCVRSGAKIIRPESRFRLFSLVGCTAVTLGREHLEDEQRHTDDDRGVGDVEVGPRVAAPQSEVQEVDDLLAEDPVA
jgi:hypothetical protein